MLDFSEYLGQEIIVCCQTTEQVDALCECIDIDKPGRATVDVFYGRAKGKRGGVGLRLYVTHSGKSVAWRGYSDADFYKRDRAYSNTPILEFDKLECECEAEPFQAPEIFF